MSWPLSSKFDLKTLSTAVDSVCDAIAREKYQVDNDTLCSKEHYRKAMVENVMAQNDDDDDDDYYYYYYY